MYSCMHADMHACMCMYVCVYVCMYVCMHACMHVYIYICIICMYACLCVHICIYVCMIACVHHVCSVRLTADDLELTCFFFSFLILFLRRARRWSTTPSTLDESASLNSETGGGERRCLCGWGRRGDRDTWALYHKFSTEGVCATCKQRTRHGRCRV